MIVWLSKLLLLASDYSTIAITVSVSYRTNFGLIATKRNINQLLINAALTEATE